MSIYLARKELIDFLDKTELGYNMKNDISRPIAEIVYKNNKKKFLDFDNYSEDNLKSLLENKNRVVYVDLEFWNYNYCKKENINKESSNDFIENLNVEVESVSSFSEGTITVLILLHEMLLNIYKIKDCDIFSSYIENFKISKRIIKNFLVNMEYVLPLTKNYLQLMKKVFNNETIYEFLFNKNNDFSIGEFRAILQNFEVENIHLSTYYVYDKLKNSRKCLQYICVLLEMYDGVIDMSSIIYKSEENHLGYFLMNLEITPENRSCYYTVLKKYIDKNGAIDIRIDKDKKGTAELRRRRLEIEDYFSKS